MSITQRVEEDHLGYMFRSYLLLKISIYDDFASVVTFADKPDPNNLTNPLPTLALNLSSVNSKSDSVLSLGR